MEHVRKSSQKHAAGAFNITEYPASLRPVVHLVAVSAFPVRNVFKKLVAACLGSDGGHSKKDSPQFSGVARLGRCPAPGQPLPLNVNKASLDDNIRPELAQHINDLGVAVNCKANWVQPFTHKAIKEGLKLGYGAFRDGVLTGHNLAQTGVHQSNETSRVVQESTVQDKMLALSQTNASRWWRLFQVVVNHTVQLGRAVLTLAGKLSNGITFNNPASEPLPLFGVFGRRIMPAKRLLAGWAEPALLPIRIVAISLQDS
jgi:hypothetical protein